MLRAVAAFLLAASIVTTAHAAEVSGVVTAVHDGDTFSIGKQRIRVFGIDAPELPQLCKRADGSCEPCGHAARDQLAQLILHNEVRCEIRGKSYDRVVGECTSGDIAIGPWMLERGQAVAYPQFLRKRDGAYLDAERQAKDANVGIWSEEFMPPADWRHHGARLECER